MAKQKPPQEPPRRSFWLTVADPENKLGLVTTREVLARLPVSRVTLWRMIRTGRFPAPIQLTASRIAWRWSDVLDWFNARKTETIHKVNLAKRTQPSSKAVEKGPRAPRTRSTARAPRELAGVR